MRRPRPRPERQREGQAKRGGAHADDEQLPVGGTVVPRPTQPTISGPIPWPIEIATMK